MNNLLAAIALMLIFEGVLPFAAPDRWKATFRKISEAPDQQVRFVGLASMVLGLILLLMID